MRPVVIVLVVSACSFPRPADVPNYDAGGDAARADGPTGDGPPVDAMPPPPVVTGQSADLVLGQPGFASTTENNGGVSGHSLAHPEDVWSDGTSLWVADLANRRVLQWDNLPIVDGATADVVLGQSSVFNNGSGSPDAQKVSGGDLAALQTNAKLGGTVAGNRILVADPGFNRITIWAPHPTTDAADASRVLGYTTFATSSPGTPTQSDLNTCSGVWSDGTKIAVADTDNHRVLLWNSFPTASGVPADVVLGQLTFTTNAAGTTASTMNLPMGVHFDGSHLYVADAGNNRVMVWNGWPTQNGQGADFFIGQPSGTAGAANSGGQGANDTGLDHPSDVIVANGALFIADSANNRVVMHYPIPTASGTKASAVLGQNDFSGSAAGAGPTGMNTPMGVGAGGGYLFVAENGNNRVVRFTLAP